MNASFRLLAILLLVATCAPSLAQQTRVITLYVNTGEISKPDEFQYCYFEGQPEDSDSREYTIEVSPGDIIEWRGVSTSSDNDRVLITSINYQGGDNVFDRNVLKDTRDNPGVVNGVIQQGTNGFEEKYVVFFKVINGTRQRNGTFQIDPKIRVRQ